MRSEAGILKVVVLVDSIRFESVFACSSSQCVSPGVVVATRATEAWCKSLLIPYFGFLRHVRVGVCVTSPGYCMVSYCFECPHIRACISYIGAWALSGKFTLFPAVYFLEPSVLTFIAYCACTTLLQTSRSQCVMF